MGQAERIHGINGAYWNAYADRWFGTTALPELGVLMPTEAELNLFGDVSGMAMLEIGCGSGHSLKYCADRGAAELWGVDMSESQLRNAAAYLAESGCSARLICSPMEADCGIPPGHFDCAYSIYALGWTTDLPGTLARIAGYLKPGGTFIFSWTHHLHRCVEMRDGVPVFAHPYFDESWYMPANLGDGYVQLRSFRTSTYINALADAGFIVERLVEQTSDEVLRAAGAVPEKWSKARMLPLSLVIKARKGPRVR